MVYVLNKEGRPLMPTKNHAKVRVLLKSGKAKVVRRCPFTVRLLYASTGYTQDVTLGVDAGYAHIGVSASTGKAELYAAQVEERTDIVKLLKARRELRRARRSRKTRYRKPRFNNRVHGKKKGWLAPSVEHKIDTHIRVVKDAMGILPVKKISIETAEFDIHKIKIGRRKGGYFDSRTLDGRKANNGSVSYKKLTLLETRKTMLAQLCHTA